MKNDFLSAGRCRIAIFCALALTAAPWSLAGDTEAPLFGDGFETPPPPLGLVARPTDPTCIVPPRPEDNPESFPQRLSASGCFQANSVSEPTGRMIGYQVNVPFWSDGSEKQRWFALPDDTTIEVLENGEFRLPAGSMVFKTFSRAGRRIETRLLVRHLDGGWAGYSYRWNDEQTDAVLLTEGRIEKIDGEPYYFPSRNDCSRCHTAAAGHTLGLETLQLNRNHLFRQSGVEANQLRSYQAVGLFSAELPAPPEQLPALPALDNPTAAPADRAHAYLHSNCAQCHRPGGPGLGAFDLSYQTYLNDPGAVELCGQTPLYGNLGLSEPLLIAPGEPDRSVLLLRVDRIGAQMMPPLAKLRVDDAGVALLRDWVAGLQGCQENSAVD